MLTNVHFPNARCRSYLVFTDGADSVGIDADHLH